MANPFRFGVQLGELPADGWVDRLRRIEELGYSTVFWPDHFGTQWEPVAALAAAAAVTERIRVGSLVYDIDYRHPVVLAKASATIHLLSGGRHEFGLGAGWMQSDYDEAGIPFERPGLRIERLEEALQIIRSMWRQERTSFSGRHYQIREVARAAELSPDDLPAILVGGGGKRVLSVAGRYADIVGIAPKVHEGRITNQTARDLAPDRVREKVGWVRDAASAAGRDPDEIELNALVFLVALTDDPKPIREGVASNTGMTPDEVADCPIFLTGPASEIRDRLEKRREETGISYVVIQGRDPALIENFAESIVAPLAGR
ncbi:MAG: TIGR03621 family F420-dependent LLM class oxidoreductase [Myxococcota bacterium]